MRMLVSLVGLVGIASGAAAQQPITASDLLRLKAVTSIDLADDASRVVYGVQSIVEGEKPGDPVYRSHLWMLDLDGGEPVQLTFGDRSDSQPAISPDGRTLAFVRAGEDGEGEDRGQVWVLALGAPGEARQVTTLEHGASQPRWRPDGGALLVSSSIPMRKIEGTPEFDDERPERDWFDFDRDDDEAPAKPDGDRRAIRNWLEKNALEDDPTVITSIDFLGEFDLSKEPRFGHLFWVDVATGAAERITEGFRNYGGATISPDGAMIAFVDSPRTEEHPDRYTRGAVYLMRADGSAVRALLDAPDRSYSSPEWLADGSGLVVSWSVATDPERWGAQTQLATVRLDGSGFATITNDWPSSAGGAIVDDGGVWFSTAWEGTFPLKMVTTGGEIARTMFDDDAGVRSFDVEGGTVVASITTIESPSELYVVRPGAHAQKVTSLNGWIEDRVFSRPTEHWVERPDGTRVQYWVMAPTNAEAGVAYPTVLQMHGGPSAMWGPGEASMWHEFQLLASWGYGVVYSNPRGSSGYGYEFQAANYQDWGFGPQGDVLAALDDASSRYDWIDEDRLFLTGCSYAGYLTAWIVAQDHRFQAAVAQRGVYDLDTFFGEGNAWRLVPFAFGGYPWEEAPGAVLERESPFTYVDQIETPLLIMHASQDLRTGVMQSQMLYRALKVMEKPVEYVRYPGAGHDLSRSGRPKQRMDRLNRIVEFFERYADNERPAPVQASSEGGE
jgi:dipeptidyl aminopeptidase/acylaminoacyl peptidase